MSRRRAEAHELASSESLPRQGSTSTATTSPLPLRSLDDETENREGEGDGRGRGRQLNNIRTTGKSVRRCLFCPRTFSKHEHLQRHLRSHTKEKPFRCTACNKCFGRHDTLLRHLRLHPATSPEGPTRQQSKGSTANVVSPAPQELSDFHRSLSFGVVPMALSTGHEGYPVGEYSTLGRCGDDSSDAYSTMGSNSQALLPLTGPNSVIPQLPGRPPVPYSTASLASGEFVATNDHERILPVLNQGQHPWESMAINSQPPPSDLMDMSSTSLDLSELGYNDLSSSWFVGDDFDLNALNATIQDSISQYATPRQSGLIPGRRNQSASMDYGVSECGTSASNAVPPRLTSDRISSRWFSNIGVGTETPATHQASPGPGMENIDVDEAYRVQLSSQLQVQSCDESLPSTGFLNLCIRMYFTRFNPIFPLLHGPTFQPGAKNSLLLLSICSVGSLFIGSADAIAQGARIFERLNKAILASWEHHLARGGGEALSMIQAAVIGQTFGMLSGNPWHLTMVDAFHGTVVAWARMSKMFRHRSAELPPHASTGQEASQTWQRWAHTEEIVRSLLGLHVHDSELACIFHHEPILRHATDRVPVASSPSLFLASNAEQWMARYQRERSHIQQPRSSQPNEIPEPRNSLWTSISMPGNFTAYAYLAGIAARIRESRNLGDFDAQRRSEIESSLVQWYHYFRRSSDKADPLCLVVLWHSTFMAMCADLDMLERAVGRDMPGAHGVDTTAELSQWVSSLDAKRCVLHGLLAHKFIREMQIGVEPAIHVPRTLFLTGITLFCYAGRQVEPGDNGTTIQLEISSLPEFKLLDAGFEMSILEADRNSKRPGKMSAVMAGGLCNITDLLQKIGHWEIARKYAVTLGSFGHEDNTGIHS